MKINLLQPALPIPALLCHALAHFAPCLVVVLKLQYEIVPNIKTFHSSYYTFIFNLQQTAGTSRPTGVQTLLLLCLFPTILTIIIIFFLPQGLEELRNLLHDLPVANFNLLNFICQ